MAAVTKQTGVTVRPINDYEYIARTLIAGTTAITNGMLVLMDATTGRANPAAATGAVYGMALNDAQPGAAVSVLRLGVIDGFTVSGNYGSAVYTAAAGALADAGTVQVGQVVPVSEYAGGKMLEVSFV
jgi:hypothetical protein